MAPYIHVGVFPFLPPHPRHCCVWWRPQQARQSEVRPARDLYHRRTPSETFWLAVFFSWYTSVSPSCGLLDSPLTAGLPGACAPLGLDPTDTAISTRISAIARAIQAPRVVALGYKDCSVKPRPEELLPCWRASQPCRSTESAASNAVAQLAVQIPKYNFQLLARVPTAASFSTTALTPRAAPTATDSRSPDHATYLTLLARSSCSEPRNSSLRLSVRVKVLVLGK
eukprot:scaffold397_cov403-Prasinococcus_capsulatus_cf.AAC.5